MHCCWRWGGAHGRRDFLGSWSWRAVATALFPFLGARPPGVLIAMLGTRLPLRQRALTGWFGVRGIGSLFYLMYAIQHGLPEELALELLHITLIVVTLSILCHGISVKPLLAWWRPERAAGGGAAPAAAPAARGADER